jgi:phage baseplate assembly protein W
MAYGFSAVIPLQKDDEDGFYSLTKTLAQNIKQNVKNILLTTPGERVMLTDFGVGLRNFLFENNTFQLQNTISRAISDQFKIYLPFVRIDNLEFFEENEQLIGIRLFYSVPSQQFSDLFEIIKPIL